jgi:creatinine amidohydrolase
MTQMHADKGVVVVSYLSKEGGLTRDPNGKETYSPSGVWGDATLATREKGRIVVEALVKSILAEIEQLRTAAVPVR